MLIFFCMKEIISCLLYVYVPFEIHNKKIFHVKNQRFGMIRSIHLFPPLPYAWDSFKFLQTKTGL